MPERGDAKIYPFFIFLFINIITGFDIFPLISGMIVGYLNVFNILTRFYNLSKSQVEKCERNCLFSFVVKLPGFYTIRMTEEFLYSDGDSMPRYDRKEPIDQFINRQLVSENPFKGEGIMLGIEEKRSMSRLVIAHDNENKFTRENSKVSNLDENGII